MRYVEIPAIITIIRDTMTEMATAINALTLEVYYRYEFLGTGSDK